MLAQNFNRWPKWVWVNSPSTLQPYHNLHGRHGLAIREVPSGWIQIYFVDGDRHSQVIDPLYLSPLYNDNSANRKDYSHDYLSCR